MKTNKKSFGGSYVHVGRDGLHILVWTKKKKGKKWKIYYVDIIHKTREEALQWLSQ